MLLWGLSPPADNGLNPAWLQTPFVFDVRNPSFCFLRFTVHDEDMFSDPNFLAQATYPVRSLRTGQSPMLSLWRFTSNVNMESLFEVTISVVILSLYVIKSSY